MDDLRQTYDRIAEDWDHDHEADAWWKSEIEAYLQRVPQGASILDLGCGPGHKSMFFAERGYDVTGVDLSEKMVERARSRVPGAHFETLDMYELPILGRTFDSVFSCASLLHIPKKDVPYILLNIAAALKPGGTCYISVKETREGSPDEIVHTENDHGYEYERFFSYFGAEELAAMMEKARLPVVYEAVTPAGKTNWLVMIGKKA